MSDERLREVHAGHEQDATLQADDTFQVHWRGGFTRYRVHQAEGGLLLHALTPDEIAADDADMAVKQAEFIVRDAQRPDAAP